MVSLKGTRSIVLARTPNLPTNKENTGQVALMAWLRLLRSADGDHQSHGEFGQNGRVHPPRPISRQFCSAHTIFCQTRGHSQRRFSILAAAVRAQIITACHSTVVPAPVESTYPLERRFANHQAAAIRAPTTWRYSIRNCSSDRYRRIFAALRLIASVVAISSREQS